MNEVLVTWHIIGLVVTGILVLVAIDLHHQRRMRQIRREEHQADGWVKVRLIATAEVWECPWCGALVRDWPQIRKHVNPELSACAAFTEAGYKVPAAPPEPPWHAEQVPEAAGVDTWQNSGSDE